MLKVLDLEQEWGCLLELRLLRIRATKMIIGVRHCSLRIDHLLILAAVCFPDDLVVTVCSVRAVNPSGFFGDHIFSTPNVKQIHIEFVVFC